jgi:hypothetical protein
MQTVKGKVRAACGGSYAGVRAPIGFLKLIADLSTYHGRANPELSFTLCIARHPAPLVVKF